MDKKTFMAFILIGAILVLTQTDWYKKQVLGVKKVSPPKTVVKDDSLKTKVKIATNEIEDTTAIESKQNDEDAEITQISGLSLASVNQQEEEDVVINTDLYEAVISTKGAVIKSWKLKKYFYDNDIPVQLIKNDGYGNLGIEFPVDEDTIRTQDLIFSTDKKDIHFTDGSQSQNIIFNLKLDSDRILRKTFEFYHDKYSINVKVELINLGDIIDDQNYSLVWLSGLEYTEKNIDEDIRNSKAYVFTGGDKEELKLPEKPNVSKSSSDIEGKIDWVAIRTKYFASIIFPKSDDDLNVRLFGETSQRDEETVNKTFAAKLKMKMPYSDRDYASTEFELYLGPLDYSIIKKYHSGFDKIMGYGPAIIRPFAKLTISVFKFLHGFIPNYGFVLIVFSILVKIVVYPLTRKSYVAMREMQKLQPHMTELREKYKNEPQKLNKEMMGLYKEHGVNPLSGCLPTLLQMPLLWSIFLVFRNTIQLRQAPFIWWINDLSSPDTILLPFSLPLIGNGLHIIPILMGATMFFQQKMTMKDPKQKAMVYFMPIFLTFIFYNFPSGLNLYYTLFNLFSILQQRITPDKHEHVETTVIYKKPSKKK